MGCAESRNTVQPQVGGSAFSVVTPGVSPPSPATTASASRSGVSRFFQRSAAASQTKPKKHKSNTLLPEPLPPTPTPVPPATTAGPSVSLTSASPTAALATSPSIAAIANAKPASPSLAPAAGAATTGPSPRLLPPDKQNLAHLTFEELSIQFLKAVKNGDLAYIGRVAQQAVRSSHAPLINIRGMWESTPLIYACQYCHPKAAMWLLEHGANVHMQNEKGVTPLLLASLEGMTSVVDWILTQHCSSADNSSSGGANAEPLDTVVPIDKQVGVVYNSAADLNIRVNPLLAASMNGHVEIAAKLLAHGASVNCGVPAAASSASAAKQFALLLAAKYGHARVVRLLIKHGADFATSDANGNHSLLLTCEASKEECAMELLRLLPGASLALEPVETIQDSISISSGDNNGSGDGDRTPATSPPPPLVSNAYVTAWKQPNCHGLTALHFAAANGLLPVVQTMLVRLQWGDDRAFLNATSVNRRECALLMACRKRQSEVVQLLVTCGADFELADRGGTTALQVLKREKKDELVKLCESKKQQQTMSSSAGVATASRVSSAVALPARSSSDPALEQETTRAESGSEQSAGESDLAFSMDETHADAAVSSSNNTAQQSTTAATFDRGGAREPAVHDASSTTGDALAARGSESVVMAPLTTQQSQVVGADLRTMSFASHALRPSDDLPSRMVEAEGAVGTSDEAKTERIAEPVDASDTTAVAQNGDSAVLVDDSEGGAPATDSSSGPGAGTMASPTPAREEAYLSSSKRPSKPKHRKKEQASPPRKPRQKKSVVKDDDAAGDAIAAASQVDSSSHDHDATPVVSSVTESAHDSTRPLSLLPDASASLSAATVASGAEAQASVASLAPLPPPALEPSLDESAAATLNSSSTHTVADTTETEASLKRERRKKKQKAHSISSSSSETKKKSRQASESGDTDAPLPLAFDHRHPRGESTSTAVTSHALAPAASSALD